MLIIFSDIWKIAAGLLLLILANIIIGTATAQIKDKFDIRVFASGVLKGFAIAISITMAYIAGHLNPTVTFTFAGTVVSLKDAVNLVMLGAYISYSYKIIVAMQGIFNIKSEDVPKSTETK